MSEQVIGAPVRRAIVVPAPAERAFPEFTDAIASWWPRDTDHVGPTPAGAVIESFEGDLHRGALAATA